MAEGSNAHEKATHHYNLGVSYERDGDIENAFREFRNALKEDPYFPYPHKSLGELLYNQGRLEEALDHMRHALKLDPDWTEARGLLADLLFELKHTEEAISHMEAALENDPGNTHYLAQLGRMFVAVGEFSDAIELLDDACSREPGDYQFQFSLAVAYGKRAMRDIDASIEHWKKAHVINPDDPKLHRNMGIAYFTRGMLEEAAMSFKIALEKNPDDSIARKFLEFAEREPDSG